MVWDAYEDEEYVEVHKYKDRPTIPIASERRVIEILEAWFRKKYPMVEGQRNDNLYKFAASLNEYGVSYALASYKCSEYQVTGFSVKEIEDIVKSAYQNKPTSSAQNILKIQISYKSDKTKTQKRRVKKVYPSTTRRVGRDGCYRLHHR